MRAALDEHDELREEILITRAGLYYNPQYRLASIEDKLDQPALRERLEALEEKGNRPAEQVGLQNAPTAP